jgi:hypothetical protein
MVGGVIESNKIVLIEWIDAESEDSWTFSPDIDHGCALIKSVGWLINESKKTVTLALNHDTKNSAYSCIIKIPKGMIKSKKIIK